MNTMKSLILGSAAGIIAIGGAQAADLPMKAKAVEYVRVCSLYGAGFYYIPGTDTCIKLGGYMRAEVTMNPGGSSDTPAYSGDAGIGSRFKNDYYTRSRFFFDIDTRTATEYGVVRAYGEIYTSFDSREGASYNPTGLATNLSNALPYDAPAGAQPGMGKTFVQFAGFTFGRADTAYNSPWAGFPANSSNGLIGVDSTGAIGVNQIQYTAQFGNGVSTSIGADDATQVSRTSIYNLNIPVNTLGTSSNAYAGSRMPDFAANVKLDQAWGLFQLSGELHEVDASFNTLAGSNGGAALVPADTVAALATSSASGHPDTKYGYALQADLWIKNVPTGPGDDLKFEAQYTKGDTKEIIGPSGGGSAPSFLMMRGSSIAFGPTTDAVYTPAGSTAGNGAFADGNLHLTTAYSIMGAYNHNWNPNWATSIFGTQSWVRYDSSATASYCANYGVAVAGQGTTYNCNPNYTVSQIGSRTIWTPVAGFAFTAEVLWTHLGTGFSGFATVSPGAPFTAVALNFKGQNTETALLRVQRNF